MCSQRATIAEVPPLKIVSPFSLVARRAEELPVFTSNPLPIVARCTSRSATPDLRHPHFDSPFFSSRFQPSFLPALPSSSRGSYRADSAAIPLHLSPVYIRPLALPFDRSDSRKSRLMHFDQDPFPRAASNGRDSFTPSLRKRVIENVPFPLKHDRTHRST